MANKKSKETFLAFSFVILFGFDGFYLAPCTVNFFARCAFVSTNSNVILFLFL